MMEEDIERLLMEAQRSRYSERRTEPRHPFVRPVVAYVRDLPACHGFSKDVSSVGMGFISVEQFAPRTLAILQIHSMQGVPVFLKAEARWSDAFGKGWYLTGWKFLSSAAPPAEYLRNPRG